MPAIESKLFRPATKGQTHVKAGVQGFAGGGKTYTGYLFAEGLIEHLCPVGGEKMPLLMYDTEGSSGFLKDLADAKGIPFLASNSRAFTDLLVAADEAVRLGGVLLIDSVTHPWGELVDARLISKERDTMMANDWIAVNRQWAQFTTKFLNADAHIIMCGRAGYEYEDGKDEEGNRQASKVGTKMKAQAETGFEPSLLVEMVREPRAPGARGEDRLVDGKLWNYIGYVLKDRSRTIEGQRLVNPTFDSFLPHVLSLNLGGTNVAVDTARSSRAVFPSERPRRARL